MKQLAVIVLGILIVLFHGVQFMHSLSDYFKMVDGNEGGMLIGAEGHIYFRVEALCDTVEQLEHIKRPT